MFLFHEQEYMSEPVDEISQSSYIKINKRFLEDLKTVNQIEDLSRFRKVSEACFASQSEQNTSVYEKQQIYKIGVCSLVKSSLYKENLQKISIKNDKNIDVKNENFNFKKKQKQIFLKNNEILSDQKENQNISKQILIQNTFEQYLVKKNQSKNVNQLQNFIQIQIKKNNDFKSKEQINDQNVQNCCPNCKMFYFSERFDNKRQFQRINYKKLLQSQMRKKQDLERMIYKLEAKMSEMNVRYNEVFKNSKNLENQVLESQKIRKENNIRMKGLDEKLEKLKIMCKNSKNESKQMIEQVKKENKCLREENERYKVFSEALSESILVLKGKKPKKLEEIWEEWKAVFESFSKNKWSSKSSKILKSPEKFLK